MTHLPRIAELTQNKDQCYLLNKFLLNFIDYSGFVWLNIKLQFQLNL